MRRSYGAHPGPKQLWDAPGVDHVGAITLADHWLRVRAFLDENIPWLRGGTSLPKSPPQSS